MKKGKKTKHLNEYKKEYIYLLTLGNGEYEPVYSHCTIQGYNMLAQEARGSIGLIIYGMGWPF